jgi:NAD+ kinase
MKISKVIIVVHQGKEHARRTADTLKSMLDKRGVQQEWLPALPPRRNLFRALRDGRSKTGDIIIACGGDGTLLQAAHRFRGTGIPILGINIGYLGFITSLQGSSVRKELDRVLNMQFVVSQRTALDLILHSRGRRISGWALNDVTITRGANPHLIRVSARVGERPLTNYRCDGLIVATPTGSTAYSLSAGGPIVSPECNVLTITPICPHALTNRSVVVNSTERIEMRLVEGSGAGDVQVDGMQLAKATPAMRMEISASQDRVPVAFLPEVNYYDILGEKLKWTGDGIS